MFSVFVVVDVAVVADVVAAAVVAAAAAAALADAEHTILHAQILTCQQLLLFGRKLTLLC